MRKIIQIASVEESLYALCDDGSVWYMGFRGDWIDVKPIPQDEPQK